MVVPPRPYLGLVSAWLEAAGDLIVHFETRSNFLANVVERIGGPLRKLDVSRMPGDSSMICASLFLCRTRGRLHELVAGEMDARDIAVNCVGLKILVVNEAPSGMEGVLRATGPTLESLSINKPWKSCTEVLENFRELCPLLATINVAVEKSAQPAYTATLCSYGDRLRFVDVSILPAELCRQILTSCPSMTCKMHLNMLIMNSGSLDPEHLELNSTDLPARLRALGPSLKNLSLLTDYQLPAQELSAAMRECTGVETLRLRLSPAAA